MIYAETRISKNSIRKRNLKNKQTKEHNRKGVATRALSNDTKTCLESRETVPWSFFKDKYNKKKKKSYYQSVCGYGSGIRDPVFFIPWIRNPDPGWIFPGSRIPDPALFVVKFSYIIFRILVMLSSWYWTTLKTYFWNHKQRAKSMFSFAAPFYIGLTIRDPDPGWKNSRIRIRDPW
jgi:hypothetical protein